MVGFEGMEHVAIDWWVIGLQFGPAGTRFLTEVDPGGQNDECAVEMRARFQYAGREPSAPFYSAADVVDGKFKVFASSFCHTLSNQGITCP